MIVVVFLRGFTSKEIHTLTTTSLTCPLLDSLRALRFIDVIRRSVEKVLRALIDTEEPSSASQVVSEGTRPPLGASDEGGEQVEHDDWSDRFS